MTEMQTHKQGPAWDYLQKWGYLRKRFSMGMIHTAVILHDGTAIGCVRNGVMENYGIESWNNLKEIACINLATLGLRNDGTIYYTNRLQEDITPLSFWPNNIKTISNSYGHVLGLTYDGYVVAFGDNDEGQCNVSDWTNIVEISATDGLSAGVKNDGTVVICGNEALLDKIASWKNIEHIYCGNSNLLVGLQFDGRVLVASTQEIFDTSEWKNIIDISCGYNVIAGIQGNGKVCLTGDVPIELKSNGLENILVVKVSKQCHERIDTVFALTNNGEGWFGEVANLHRYSAAGILFMADGGMNGCFVVINQDGTIAINYGSAAVYSNNWKIFNNPVRGYENNENKTAITKPSASDSVSNEYSIKHDDSPKEYLSNVQSEDTSNSNNGKTTYLVLAILFLFLFWPVSIYFFYKYSQS